MNRVSIAVRMVAPVLLASALGLSTVIAQQFPRQAGPIEDPLTAYIANLRTLSVAIGNETIPFLLDTGGGVTVLTPDVARAAGCVPFGRVTGFRSSGERLDLRRCGTVSMRLGPLTVHAETAIMDVMASRRPSWRH